jgi:hypothetical protein
MIKPKISELGKTEDLAQTSVDNVVERVALNGTDDLQACSSFLQACLSRQIVPETFQAFGCISVAWKNLAVNVRCGEVSGPNSSMSRIW